MLRIYFCPEVTGSCRERWIESILTLLTEATSNLKFYTWCAFSYFSQNFYFEKCVTDWLISGTLGAHLYIYRIGIFITWCWSLVSDKSRQREVDFLSKFEFVNIQFGGLHSHYAFPQIFTLGGASWTLGHKVVNCKIKLANKKFSLVNVLAYINFIWTKKGVIIDAEIWIIETYYYSLLKSHLAVQICSVSYVEYYVNS